MRAFRCSVLTTRSFGAEVAADVAAHIDDGDVLLLDFCGVRIASADPRACRR